VTAVDEAPSGITQPPKGSTGGMEPVGVKTHRVLGLIPTWILWALVVVWTIPTVGLLIQSFRTKSAQQSTGWWTVVTDPQLTLDNYRRALFDPPGGYVSFSQSLLNSFAIAIPGTVVPILVALSAAYAFAWMPFKGRSWLFIGTVAMLAIPLQMALVPLLQLFSNGAHVTLFGSTLTIFPDLNLVGKPAAVWLTHTGFGLPLAIFLFHNYIASLPGDVFEAATIDGANHFGIFWRIVLPLSKPAIASFAIFQFLWVWNDYLIALIFLTGNKNASPLTIQLVNLVTSKGQGTELLPAAAFIAMVVPLIIFFSLQRYFVRGLLAGSVKG
jgi:alpha-glucoside transport system permease protein